MHGVLGQRRQIPLVRASASPVAGFQVCDVTLDEGKTIPGLAANDSGNIIEIVLMTGREVVQADNLLPQLPQFLQKMRANEASDTCHQPSAGVNLQLLLRQFVTCSCRHALPNCTRPSAVSACLRIGKMVEQALISIGSSITHHLVCLIL